MRVRRKWDSLSSMQQFLKAFIESAVPLQILIESAASVVVYNINVQHWKNSHFSQYCRSLGAWKRVNLLETAWGLSARNIVSPMTEAILEHVHKETSVFSVSPKGSFGNCLHFISIHHGSTFPACTVLNTPWNLVIVCDVCCFSLKICQEICIKK